MFPSIKEYHMFQVCTEFLEEFKKYYEDLLV